ncbi:hypothetical protein ACIQ9R_38385 [Streptomyces sp. NPDC094447]
MIAVTTNSQQSGQSGQSGQSLSDKVSDANKRSGHQYGKNG